MAGLHSSLQTSSFSAMKVYAGVSPLGGTRCPATESDDSYLSLQRQTLVPLKKHNVLCVIKHIGNTTAYCATQCMPERKRKITNSFGEANDECDEDVSGVWANSSWLRCHFYRMAHHSLRTSWVCVDTTAPSVNTLGHGLAG